MFVTCHCLLCSRVIELDVEHIGDALTCPQCGLLHDAFGLRYGEDPNGYLCALPMLPDLMYFDTVGSLYIMKSEALPGLLKIGITKRPLSRRAREHTRDFRVAQPFTVFSAWQMRNYRLVENFISRRLRSFKFEYIKERVHSRDLRTGEPCISTRRSCEVYKCSYEQAYEQIDLIVRKATDVIEFEKWFLKIEQALLKAFRACNQKDQDLTARCQTAIDVMSKRLSMGDTSMCVAEVVDAN